MIKRMLCLCLCFCLLLFLPELRARARSCLYTIERAGKSKQQKRLKPKPVCAQRNALCVRKRDRLGVKTHATNSSTTEDKSFDRPNQR